MRFLSATLVLLVALVGCAAPTAPPSIAKSQLAPTGTLRIGVVLAPNPGTSFAVLDANKGPKGPPVSLGEALARANGLPSTLKIAGSSGQLTDWLVAQEVDVAFLPVDDARRQKVDFGPDYFIFESTFLIRPGLGLSKIAELDRPGIHVIGVANTATIRAAGSALKTNRVDPIPSVDEAVKAMRAGQADAFAFSRDGLVPIAASMPGSVVLSEPFLRAGVAPAIPKGRPEAMKLVSTFMEDAKRSGLVKQSFVDAGLGTLEVAPPGRR